MLQAVLHLFQVCLQVIHEFGNDLAELGVVGRESRVDTLSVILADRHRMLIRPFGRLRPMCGGRAGRLRSAGDSPLDRLRQVLSATRRAARLFVPFHGMRGRATIGICTPLLRSRRVAVYPSITGICISIRTTSKVWRLAASRASTPFSAVTTSAPARCRISRVSLRFVSPSSTTRMRVPWRLGEADPACGRSGWMSAKGKSERLVAWSGPGSMVAVKVLPGPIR